MQEGSRLQDCSVLTWPSESIVEEKTAIHLAAKTPEQTVNNHLFYMNQNAVCAILKKNIHPYIREILVQEGWNPEMAFTLENQVDRCLN